MRRSLVLLLLLQAVAVLGSHDQQVLSEERSPEPVDPTSNDRHNRHAQFEWDVEEATPPIRQPGADLVDEALAHLRKIPDTQHRRRRRSSGLVGQLFDFTIKSLFTWNVPAAPQASPIVTRGPLHDAVELLQQASQQNNSDALYILAEMNFYRNYSHPRDLSTAFSYYDKLATVHGNTTAQFMLGFYYSTGIGNVVPRNQAKAMLYYTFAAARGDTRAEMALGFRHHAAIGTPKNCELAAKYYKRVADKAVGWFRSGPPGGMSWVQESWRIADDNGGAYGRGASAASSGLNAIKINLHSHSNAAIDDVIEYLDLLSQKGDSQSSLDLGRIYYEGQRRQERNMELAKKYFFIVAKRYWKKDGRVLENYKAGSERIVARAAGYIGRMYLRGEGLEQSYEKAKMWFERGRSLGDASSMHGLGLMLLHGHGVQKNIALATELFKAAAEDYAPAQVELAVLYLDQGGPEDVRVANNYFELAARYGLIEAHYYLAELIFHGVGRDKSCGMALQYYKGVVEKAEPLVSSWGAANLAYEEGDYETALLHYLIMAEQGYERAQNNVAHLLDPDQSRLALDQRVAKSLHLPLLAGRPSSSSPLMQDPSTALIYWTRSSRQGNVDSLVKMGDYYFYGIGTEPDFNKAVQCYTGAADYSQSAQALYNLGWMHENGVGLTQDYHLAKRYYDQALEVNQEAYLPVTLSLLKLRLRSAWNTFTHGPIHSIQDDPKPKKDWSLAEWITNFIQDDTNYYEDSLYDDIFDDTIGDRQHGLDEDSGLELLFIFGISMALVGLLYYRQFRQQQNRRQQDEERRRQNNGAAGDQGELDEGVFPRANDPEFANWVAGGIGH
ncbi:Ubiquitin-protein ligase sel1 [Scedosporium apiospermum]|uniref:Ubiquitin-protein ligase sel1 n=1 Tax=Pseudallescheria apiosperma TaxID=563466 RepID=A0A084G4W5_PSEDA|nr:Ubiquitin-protein ligase sel1 [Scedosporium apiospermum]KEZ42377.1 Ubiquitin-protein ligase sel1 [Scedosporium apiospermum]